MAMENGPFIDDFPIKIHINQYQPQKSFFFWRPTKTVTQWQQHVAADDLLQSGLEGGEKAVGQMLDETNAVREDGMPRLIAGEPHGNDRPTGLPVGKPPKAPDFLATPKLLWEKTYL